MKKKRKSIMIICLSANKKRKVVVPDPVLSHE